MNIHQQIGPETYIYMENYDIPKAEGWKFSMEKIGKQGLYYKLTSDKINWDSIRSLWVIGNYYVRTISGMKETLRSGVKLDTILNMKPADFETDIEDVKVMNYAKLRKFIKEKRAKGAADISKYEVKKYERIAFPFATIILTLIGLSLSSRKVRGGIGVNLGTGIALTFLYIFFMQVSTVFATFGNFPPLFAVWTPNIVFGIIAIFLIRIAPK
jgi:lipopolysaccharide export system permease protein